MPGYDTNFGAKRAREAREREARERLGLDAAAPVPCVVTLVEEGAGLPVVVANLPPEVAGALWRDGDGAIVWVNGAQAVERQRFTVAHELGHVCCRHEQTRIDTAATISAAADDPPAGADLGRGGRSARGAGERLRGRAARAACGRAGHGPRRAGPGRPGAPRR